VVLGGPAVILQSPPAGRSGRIDRASLMEGAQAGRLSMSIPRRQIPVFIVFAVLGPPVPGTYLTSRRNVNLGRVGLDTGLPAGRPRNYDNALTF